MKPADWVEEFPAAVTVCDRRGVIVSMNRAAGEVFRREGGRKKLIHQAPWFRKERFAGLVELSIVLPRRMAHRVRERK